MHHSLHLLHPLVKTTVTACQLQVKVLACEPELADTAAFCAHYGYRLEQSANTIIVAAKNQPDVLACCVVLATTRLDVNKKVCQLLGVKKASFAPLELTEQLTGMQTGGVTAVGIEHMPVFVDHAVMSMSEVVMGGGNRSSKLVLDPQELLKLPDVTVIEDLARPSPTA